MSKPGALAPCKPWLKVYPDQGILVPTEVLEIKFTLLINSEIATLLNFNTDTLDDVIIIHLENGADHYVSKTGTGGFQVLNLPKR